MSNWSLTSPQEVDSIFGTPIGFVKVEQNTDILQSTNNNFEMIDDKSLSWKPSKVSKNMRVLESYPKIKKILLDHFISFADGVLGVNCNFEITTSWLTKCEKGEESTLHLHGNSFWSGIYYYGENYCESSPIEFENPLVNHIRDYGFYVIPEKATQYNKLVERVLPTKNMLIMFPSYLKHRIGTHTSDISRYSLAFNIVPIGHYGGGDSQYDTKWVT